MGTRLLWDPIEDNIVKELDDSSATVADYTTEPYLYGDLMSQDRSGQSRFYHFDGLGSTMELTDSGGDVTDTRRYSAFGETTESTGSTDFPFQYAGRKGYYCDAETRAYIARRRCYHPSLSRWLSIEPSQSVRLALLLGGVSVYVYVRNRTSTYLDPSGLQEVEACRECEEIRSLLIRDEMGRTHGTLACLKKKKCKLSMSCQCCKSKKSDILNLAGCTVQGEDGTIYVAVCCETSNVQQMFEHEITHAIQLCDQMELGLDYPFSSNECWDCMLREMIAYVCAGQCTSLEGCKDLAQRSCAGPVIANLPPRSERAPTRPPDPTRPMPAKNPCKLAVPADFKEKEPKAYKVKCTLDEMASVSGSEDLKKLYDAFLANGRDAALCRELSNPDCVLNLPRIPE